MKTLLFHKEISFKRAIKIPIFKSTLINKLHPFIDWELCTFDIKIHKLNKGDCPCRPIWHYDGHNDPFNTPLNYYMLFLQGNAECKTKFFKNEPPLKCENTERSIHNLAKFYENIIGKTGIIQLDYNKCNYYTNKQLHQADYSQNNGERLLIRANLKRLIKNEY